MAERQNTSLRIFFNYLGIGFVILCIRTGVILKPSVEAVKAVFYTLISVFTHDIWLAIAIMFSHDFYQWIKNKILGK